MVGHPFHNFSDVSHIICRVYVFRPFLFFMGEGNKSSCVRSDYKRINSNDFVRFVMNMLRNHNETYEC
jgi:hypothetical protein